MGILRKCVNISRLVANGLLWLKVWHSMPVWSWLRAAAAYAEGNFISARDFYRIGLSKHASHPAHGSARLDLAVCLEKLGSIDEAIQELSYIVSLRIPLSEAYLMQSRMLAYLGKNRYALQTLGVGLEVCPSDSEILAKYVHLLLLSNIGGTALEESIEKIKLKRKSLSLDGVLRQSLDCALGHYELKEGDFVVGENMLVRCLATGEAPKEAFILRAELFLSSDRIIQAKEMYRRALDMDARDPIPYIELSRIYCYSNEVQDIQWAVQCAESACKMTQWRNLEAIACLVEAFQANGQYERAGLLQDFFNERVETPMAIRAKA